jgi:hypothetical protein
MSPLLTTYFDGEKYAGLFLGAIGLAVLAGAGALASSRGQLRAFAITLLVFGLAELAIGFGLYVKSGPQLARLSAQLAGDPTAFYAGEHARMVAVQRTFAIIEVVWLLLIFASAALAYWRKHDVTVSGVALGILVNVALLLAFDIIAERRGGRYLAGLGAAAQMAMPAREPGGG